MKSLRKTIAIICTLAIALSLALPMQVAQAVAPILSVSLAGTPITATNGVYTMEAGASKLTITLTDGTENEEFYVIAQSVQSSPLDTIVIGANKAGSKELSMTTSQLFANGRTSIAVTLQSSLTPGNNHNFTLSLQPQSVQLADANATSPSASIKATAGALVTTNASLYTQEIGISNVAATYAQQLVYFSFNVKDAKGVAAEISTAITSLTGNATGTQVQVVGTSQVMVGYIPANQVGNFSFNITPKNGGTATKITIAVLGSAANGLPGLVYTTNASFPFFTATATGPMNTTARTQAFMLNNLYPQQPINQSITLNFSVHGFDLTGTAGDALPIGTAISILSTTGAAFSQSGVQVIYNPFTATVDVTFNPTTLGATPISFRLVQGSIYTTVTMSTTGATTTTGSFAIELGVPTTVYAKEGNTIKATLMPVGSATPNTTVEVTFTATNATVVRTGPQTITLTPTNAGAVTLVATLPTGTTLTNGDPATGAAEWYVDPTTGQQVYGVKPTNKKTVAITAVARDATTPDTSTPPTTATNKTGTPLKSGISIYDASGKVIGTLTSMSSFPITGETSNRLAFSYNGTTAYLPKALINVTINTGGSTTGDGVEMGLNILRWCSFRDGASHSARRIVKLVPKDRLIIYSNENGWSYGSFNGKTGYVETQYLKP